MARASSYCREPAHLCAVPSPTRRSTVLPQQPPFPAGAHDLSTLSKLNPKVRQDRYARRALLRQARAVHGKIAAERGVGSPLEYQAFVIANLLEKIYRTPNRAGTRKNQLYRRIARELSGVQLDR